MRIIEWMMTPVRVTRFAVLCAAVIFACSIADFLLMVWPR